MVFFIIKNSNNVKTILKNLLTEENIKVKLNKMKIFHHKYLRVRCKVL